MERHLLDYYPPVIQEIKDFKRIAAAEEPEIAALWEAADTAEQSLFLLDAELPGIRRWEQLLKILPLPGAAIEERRAELLQCWNRTIPYTRRRLHDYIQVVTGDKNYTLTICYAEYVVKLLVREKPANILRSVSKMVWEMMPANMILEFAGGYQFESSVPIRVLASLFLRSDFYPRSNVPYAHLDGRFLMDGSRQMDGYNMIQTIDFYPVKALLGMGIENRLKVLAAGYIRTHFSAKICYDEVGIIRLQKEVKSATICMCKAGYKISTNTKAEAALFLPAEAVQKVKTDSAADFITEIMVSITAEGQASVGMTIEETSLLEASLTAEKNLWKLDGSVKLDGSRKLNAQVFHYVL